MTVATGTDFVKKIESLPPLPAVALNIQSLTRATNVSADHIGKALRRDPAIASRILRVANSPFYGATNEVTQISRAVVLLGSRAIRNLVLGLCARNSLVGKAGDVPEHAMLWRHSIAAAVVADLIARQVGFSPPEEAFLAGLLHDAGKLAMVGVEPDFISSLFAKQLEEVHNLDMEREHFGLDHAEAGRQILARWGLPDSLCQVAGRHHTSEIGLRDDADRLVAITIIANDIVRIMGYGPDAPVGSYHRLREAAASIGLSSGNLENLSVGLTERIDEAVDLLEASATGKQDSLTLSDFSRILWISNEGTGDVNLCQAFLAGTGCEIQQVVPADLPNGLSSEDACFIDLGPDDPTAAVQIASDLVSNGSEKIGVLMEPRDGMAGRRREPKSGACIIPRVFTVFDLLWLEQQWQK